MVTPLDLWVVLVIRCAAAFCKFPFRLLKLASPRAIEALNVSRQFHIWDRWEAVPTLAPLKFRIQRSRRISCSCIARYFWMRIVVGRFAQLPALAVCGPQFPPGSSHHHHELFQDFVPAHQRRSFRFSERSSIVDRGDAMLFMSEQSLHHERLNTGIV